MHPQVRISLAKLMCFVQVISVACQPLLQGTSAVAAGLAVGAGQSVASSAVVPIVAVPAAVAPIVAVPAAVLELCPS